MMIYLLLLATFLATGVFFLLWRRERKISMFARAESKRLELENKLRQAKLDKIYEVVTKVECGVERRVGEHDELAQSLQHHAVALVRAAPGLAAYLNRNYSFHRALLDVVQK